MDQISTIKQSTVLSVSSKVSQNSLLHFYGAEFDIGKSTADIALPLDVLAQSDQYQECWIDHTDIIDVEFEGETDFKALESKHHLVMAFNLNHEPLVDLVVKVYQFAYSISADLGFNHLIRVWNYLDGINTIENDVERYQTFCVARHQVLEHLEKLDAPNPAATAIGGHNGENLFVFLFSKQPGIVVENKRQISAWQYPKKYSPKQPRFSRAMQYGDLLMCSGTASVVGHETIHLNDLSAQFNECLINVQALLDESSLDVDIESGLYRFYLRDKTLINQVVKLIESKNIMKYIVLEGDICRENLLIECEAVFQ